MSPAPKSIALVARVNLDARLTSLENLLGTDVLGLIGPILDGVEHKVRDALEAVPDRKQGVAIVLGTEGGIVEVVERMVEVIRHHYAEVRFIVPDIAMSAGTVFAMSGDSIWMDYFSVLGPIDPQVFRDGKLVPALSYLIQYDRLIAKAHAGQLSNAEFALLNSMDLAELNQFEMASQLSVSLLVTWLTKYKFKDWTTRESSGAAVTDADRAERAKEIADALMNNQRWGSHGRGIGMRTLVDDLNLRIDDFGTFAPLRKSIREYYAMATDFMKLHKLEHLAHSRGYL